MSIAIPAAFVVAVIAFIALLTQRVKPVHWRHACYELLIVWFVSNLPIGLLLLGSILDTGEIVLARFAQENIKYGEVLIYVAAILSPVIYVLFLNLKESARAFLAINLAGSFTCMLIGAYVYARQVSSVPSDATALANTALSLYFVSLTLWFFTLVYQRAVSTPEPGEAEAARAKEIEKGLPS